jgi:hypothetical protein
MWTQTPVTALSSHPSQKQIPSNRAAMPLNFFSSLLGYLLRGACVFFGGVFSSVFFVGE